MPAFSCMRGAGTGVAGKIPAVRRARARARENRWFSGRAGAGSGRGQRRYFPGDAGARRDPGEGPENRSCGQVVKEEKGNPVRCTNGCGALVPIYRLGKFVSETGSDTAFPVNEG